MNVRWFRYAALLGAFLIFVLYLPGLSGPWLFDDHPNLLQNYQLDLDSVVADEWRTAALSSNSGPLRRPLAMFSFAAQTAVGDGLDPAALKAGNLVLHLLCALVLGGLAWSVLAVVEPELSASRRRLLALLAAGLWSLQPLHVSTVLYPVQRMAQVAALFLLAGLWLYVHYRQRWALRGATPAELGAAAIWLALLTGLAALGKENGLLLPWLLVAVEVSLFRGSWGGRESVLLQRLGWVLLLLPLLLGLLLLLQAPEWLLGGYASREFTLVERLLTQGRLLWQYLYLLVIPDIGAMGLHHDDLQVSRGLSEPWTTALALAAWLSLVVAAFWLRQRLPLLLLAVLVYLVGHSMESGPWPLEMVFEHRNYLPSAGFAIFAARALGHGLSRFGKLPAVAVPLMCCLVYAAFLFVRTSTWSDELRLAQVNSLNHPGSVRAQHAVANVLMERFLAPQEYGLNREQRLVYLAEARYRYEANYQSNPTDLGALIMLYQIDAGYYAKQVDASHWLPLAREAAQSKVLQVSDYVALQSLMRCLGEGRCHAVEGDAELLIEDLKQRYPGSARIARLHYEYLLAIDAPREERVAVLKQVLELSPTASGLRYRLIEELGAENRYGPIFEQARTVLAHDPRFLQLSTLRGMFPHTGVEAP
ncbi:hypothetical protein Q6D67_06835 [Haliea sp. E1-2-M8]|uniref:hypothetical protein n=1 Tax=Haliea sp. E1-2-M8 TaxID=3064706 RepID=UPI0027189F16|nr:hypothetical protein [Haliea sp. E1-2-M8]MDO8861412.1 hypothetical protein [Haliea sp. E1-2-M8]